MITRTFASEIRTIVELNLQHDGRAEPFLMVGTPERATLMVGSRRQPRPGATDHVSELAVAVAAVRPQVAALAIPSRFRDLRSQEVVARSMVVTTLHATSDAVGIRADSLSLPTEEGDTELGPTMPLDPSTSPVASLLYDAATCDTDLDPVETMSVLTAWGHAVMARDMDAADARLPPPPGRASYAAGRLARELQRRHQPMAEGGVPPKRPAVPADLPDGFVPACPI